MLFQHGDSVYLHVLQLTRVYTPWLTVPKPFKSAVPYRVHDFLHVIRSHFVYSSNVELSDAAMPNEEHLTIMKHNGFIYHTPASIERHTRLFPLCQDPDAVLFNHEVGGALVKHFQYLVDAALRNEMIPDEDSEYAKNLLEELYNSIQSNDTKWFPELASNHTQRWELYRKLWSELRVLFITMNHHSLVEVMDRLWPQFFYEGSSENAKNADRKNKRMIEVQRDRHGNVLFPIHLSALMIQNLGKVIWDRPAYHTDKYIWPVGFKSTRYYTSVVNVERRCAYTSEIREGGEAPIFVLTSEDAPDQPILAQSATAAWTVIVKKVNEIKTEEQGKRVFTNVSGPEYFGLAHPTVMKLISELPNAEKCDRPNAPYQPVAKSKEDGSDSVNDDNATATNTIDEDDSDHGNNDDFEIVQHKKLVWRKGENLFQFFKQKVQRTIGQGADFDGRNEGPNGLYSAMNQKLASTPTTMNQDGTFSAVEPIKLVGKRKPPPNSDKNPKNAKRKKPNTPGTSNSNAMMLE